MMMAHAPSRTVAVALAGVLLLLGGLIYPAMVPHALHHGHHQAATHSTAICSWLCAAGQVAETGAPVRPVTFDGVTVADPLPSTEPTQPLRFALPSRAPPSTIS